MRTRSAGAEMANTSLDVPARIRLARSRAPVSIRGDRIVRRGAPLVNVESLLSAYRRRFGGSEPTVLVRAPGRVNLIGEHVDYNDGLVLPIAINRATYAIAGRAEQGCIRIFSTRMDQTVEFDPDDNPPPDAQSWDAYARGVAAELTKAGVRLCGTQVLVDGDLPVGAGLSSSAALEVSVAFALSSVAGATLSRRAIAHLCRAAEHRYASVPCGIMDQLVCTLAEARTALLLDCRDERTEHIPWPDDETLVLIVDSRCPHRLADGTYAERVHACALATAHLRNADPTVRSLRDVAPQLLVDQRSALGDTLYRRARHVISEIGRTRDAADALKRGDFAALGRAMNASHVSLRDDYHVSSPQLDDLAEAVRCVPGVFGARMTGAGFGGCVVAVARRDVIRHVESAVRKRYDTKHGVTAQLTATHPCRGATVTRLAPA